FSSAFSISGNAFSLSPSLTKSVALPRSRCSREDMVALGEVRVAFGNSSLALSSLAACTMAEENSSAVAHSAMCASLNNFMIVPRCIGAQLPRNGCFTFVRAYRCHACLYKQGHAKCCAPAKIQDSCNAVTQFGVRRG